MDTYSHILTHTDEQLPHTRKVSLPYEPNHPAALFPTAICSLLFPVVVRLTRPEFWQFPSFATDSELCSLSPGASLPAAVPASAQETLAQDPASSIASYVNTFVLGNALVFPVATSKETGKAVASDSRRASESSRNTVDVLSPQDHLFGSQATYMVIIKNTTEAELKILSLKVALESNSRKVFLIDPSKFVSDKLARNQFKEYMVTFELREIHDYFLRAEVTVSKGEVEKRQLRCDVPLKVSHPIDVKSTVSIIEDSVFYEFCVQNNTRAIITLRNPIFHPTEGHLFRDFTKMSILEDQGNKKGSPSYLSSLTGSDDNWFGDSTFLLPGHMKNYVYAMDKKLDLGSYDIRSNLYGKFEVSWYSATGEFGRVQTKNVSVDLKEIAPGVVANIFDVPKNVFLEQAFTVGLEIQNVDVSTIKYAIQTNPGQMTSFLVTDILGQISGEIPPSESIKLELVLYPLVCGICSVNGINLSITGGPEDRQSDASGEDSIRLDNFPQILVQPSSD